MSYSLIRKSLCLMAVTCFSTQAFAAGTLAGTTIAVEMDIDFDVSSTAQSQANSTQNLKVAHKIDVNVSTTEVDTANAKVVSPNAAGAFTTFSITNEGNLAQSYTFTATIDDTNDVFVGSPSTTIYEDADDDCDTTGDRVDVSVLGYVGLAVDEVKTICVVSSTNVNSGAATDLEAPITLIATTTDSGTTTATTDDVGVTFDPEAVTTQKLFSDGENTNVGTDSNGDGKHSAIAIFKVGAAALSVSQNLIVVYDNDFANTANCATDATGALDDDKSIPGACVNFSYTLTNASGSATAENIVWEIDIPTQLTYVGETPSNDNEVTGTSCDTAGFTYASGITDGEIVCNIASLPGNASRTLQFRATIN